MPAISKIRFTNVVYENGGKRYNDEIFQFDGHNGALLLENGGGKTVFIQTAMQAIIPHIDMADRKIKDTLSLENGPAHIAIEWIIHDKPRRYAVTATTLFLENNLLNSLKYVYEYEPDDQNAIEEIPFTIKNKNGTRRPASRGEISEYYQRMNKNNFNAHVFSTISEYGNFIQENLKIIPSEWRKIAIINSGEGNVDEFFNKCKTTTQLLNSLLIPVVEEAIEGDNTQKFVETFEKQREHFKKNKILQEKIIQSQKVKKQIDYYVDNYKEYHDVQMKYLDTKKEAKTLYGHTDKLLKGSYEKQAFVNEKFEALNRDTQELERKEISYKITLVMEEIGKIDTRLDHLNKEYTDIKTRYDSDAARKQNIELTILENKIGKSNNDIAYFKEQLEKLDQDVEISQIREELENNSSQIKGCYTNELQLIDKEINGLMAQKETFEAEVKALSKKLEDIKLKEKNYIEEISQIKAEIKYLKQDLEKIKKEILDNYEEETVKEQLEEWKKRVSLLDDQMRKIANDKVRLNKEYEILKEEEEVGQSRISELSNKCSVIKVELDNINEASEKLIGEIEIKSHHLYISGTIYSKQETIIQSLEDKQEKLYHKKEKAIVEERIHGRVADLYRDARQFTADPLLEKIVIGLQDQVSFISLGTNYLQTVKDSLKLGEKELFDKYPLWAITLITTSGDISQVEKTINKCRQDMMHPVIIQTVEEINKLLKSDNEGFSPFNGKEIYPYIWADNLSKDKFDDWKKELIESTEQYKVGRIKAENEYNTIRNLLEKARAFFDKYSYEKYHSLKDEADSQGNDLMYLKGRQLEVKKELTRIDEEKEILDRRYKEHQNEMADREIKIRKALDYIQKENALKNKLAMLMEKEKGYNGLSADKHTYEKEVRTNNDIIEELKEQESQFIRNRNRILDHELYQEVNNVDLIYSDKDIDSLRRIRQDLQNKLNGIHSGRNSLVNSLKKEEQNLEDFMKDKHQKLKEAKYDVHKIEVYYDNEILELIEKINSLGEKLGNIQAQINTEKMNREGKVTEKRMYEKELFEKFVELYPFNESIESIPDKLKSERESLKDKQQRLNKENKTITAEINELDQLLRDFEINNGEHKFLGEDVSIISRDENYFIDFNYSRSKKTKELFKQLNHWNHICDDAGQRVNTLKETFVDYCKENIDDYRLKDTAINGINSKKGYTELLEYQEKMSDIIHKIIKVAEDDRRESDAELQIFLAHLHTYIKTIAIELDVIQRKTKIQVDEVVKQIFLFDIPEWDENEGKEELRQYIDQIIEYFENEKESFENDEVGMRNVIEKKLSVKNLLQVVMKDRMIKIKCRKVTNDMKIGNKPMSWESSNKWSGGEKWSKNMTLFLGILNYLAEKKQHLTPNQKRQRTVILDNPFGKASSKHVLEPVFFIADKLGFQIIALTAHAEGKFISDYFPVVYSCRLRKAVDGEKQIMTNERQINYAYIRENSPMSVYRLQEVNQLGLL